VETDSAGTHYAARKAPTRVLLSLLVTVAAGSAADAESRHLRGAYGSAMTGVEVFVDPSCAWTWVTSCWLREVAPHRALSLSWRSYCLEIRDDRQLAPGVPEEERWALQEGRALAHRMLRIFEAARASDDEHAVDRLYSGWGRRYMRGFLNPDPRWLRESVEAAGVDLALLAAADDDGWDAEIHAAMAVAYAFGGANAQTPVMVVAGDPPRGFKGPVMASAPTGEAAVRLWDAICVLNAEPAFFELTRPRTSSPYSTPAD